MSVDPRLERLLGGDARQDLRRRLRRALMRDRTGSVRFARLSEDDQQTLAAWLGRPVRPSASMSVDLRTLERELVRAGLSSSLRAALEAIDGPIVDPRVLLSAREQRWAQVFAQPGPEPWAHLAGAEAGRRLLRRLARQDPDAGEHLSRQAMSVLRQLPAGGVPRSMLAASVLGNAHALDNGQPVATAVLAAWRLWRGAREPAADLPGPADKPFERERDVWADAGVLVNALARPALVLNLPATADGSRLFAAGQPGYLSLRQLVQAPPIWPAPVGDIFVCENPNIVAWAADHLGEGCAPMVCTDGMPAAAQRQLLARLTSAGARLRFHGDFDWPGIRIANTVLRMPGAEPWRMTAADYHEAVATAGNFLHPLAGEPVDAVWDGGLREAMESAGVAVAEEAVVQGMRWDLEDGAGDRVSSSNP